MPANKTVTSSGECLEPDWSGRKQNAYDFAIHTYKKKQAPRLLCVFYISNHFNLSNFVTVRNRAAEQKTICFGEIQKTHNEANNHLS